jgi:hypothetical protein
MEKLGSSGKPHVAGRPKPSWYISMSRAIRFLPNRPTPARTRVNLRRIYVVLDVEGHLN